MAMPRPFSSPRLLLAKRTSFALREERRGETVSGKSDVRCALPIELNRSQANWHFEINFDTFNSDNLSSAQLSQCDAAPLCYANSVAGNKALIGVTEERLGQDSFWQNAGSVSVISVNEWEA